MQAKDIPDDLFVRVVDALSKAPKAYIDHVSFQPPVHQFPIPHSVSRWDVNNLIMHVPQKVIMAKAKALIKKGFLDGCACGCRGDFEVTDAGKSLLDV